MALSSRWLVTASYSLAILLIMIRGGQYDTVSSWIWTAIFLLWAVSPVVLLCLIERQSRIIPVAAAVLGASGIAIYLDSLFGDDTSSTAGLIFLFLPVWQDIAVLVFIAAFFGIRALRTKLHDR